MRVRGRVSTTSGEMKVGGCQTDDICGPTLRTGTERPTPGLTLRADRGGTQTREWHGLSRLRYDGMREVECPVPCTTWAGGSGEEYDSEVTRLGTTGASKTRKRPGGELRREGRRL